MPATSRRRAQSNRINRAARFGGMPTWRSNRRRSRLALQPVASHNCLTLTVPRLSDSSRHACSTSASPNAALSAWSTHVRTIANLSVHAVAEAARSTTSSTLVPNTAPRSTGSLPAPSEAPRTSPNAAAGGKPDFDAVHESGRHRRRRPICQTDQHSTLTARSIALADDDRVAQLEQHRDTGVRQLDR